MFSSKKAQPYVSIFSVVLSLCLDAARSQPPPPPADTSRLRSKWKIEKLIYLSHYISKLFEVVSRRWFCFKSLENLILRRVAEHSS